LKYKLKTDNQVLLFTTEADLKRRVKLIRDIQEDYEITYPDGWKAKYEYIYKIKEI